MGAHLKSIPGSRDRPEKQRSGNRAGDASTRPHLYVVGSSDRVPAVAHCGMWRNDTMQDPVRHTTLEDWPHDHEFIALIEGALNGENYPLAAQLERDRAYCAEMRARLEEIDVLTCRPG